MKIIKLARPFVLGHTVIISLMYCLIAHYNFDQCILATLALLLIHSSAQMTNLLWDVDIDKINKPWRPTVTGEVNIKRAWFANILAAATGFILGYNVNLHFFKWLLVLAIFAWSFTIAPVRKNEFTHALWMSITRGFIPAYAITGIVPMSILMSLWVLAFNVAKDYRDIEGDVKYGIRTIAMHGEAILVLWMFGVLILFYFTLTLFIMYKLLPLKALLIYCVTPIAFAIPFTLDSPPAFSDNNLAYDLFWYGLKLLAVFFAVIYLT